MDYPEFEHAYRIGANVYSVAHVHFDDFLKEVQKKHINVSSVATWPIPATSEGNIFTLIIVLSLTITG